MAERSLNPIADKVIVRAIATTQLSNVLPGATPTLKLAHSMALVVVIASLCALLLSGLLPEPSPELPED